MLGFNLYCISLYCVKIFFSSFDGGTEDQLSMRSHERNMRMILIWWRLEKESDSIYGLLFTTDSNW